MREDCWLLRGRRAGSGSARYRPTGCTTTSPFPPQDGVRHLRPCTAPVYLKPVCRLGCVASWAFGPSRGRPNASLVGWHMGCSSPSTPAPRLSTTTTPHGRWRKPHTGGRFYCPSCWRRGQCAQWNTPHHGCRRPDWSLSALEVTGTWWTYARSTSL